MVMKSAGGEIHVPRVGFGTYAAGDNNWCYDATLQALKVGYRHIDCAWHYGVYPAAQSQICTNYVWLT